MTEELVLGLAKRLQAIDHGGRHTWESCDQIARDRALRQAADIVESTGLAAKDARISELESALKEILATNMDLRCTYCGDQVHSVPISRFEGRSTYDEACEAIKAHDLLCPKSPFLARIAELEEILNEVSSLVDEEEREPEEIVGALVEAFRELEPLATVDSVLVRDSVSLAEACRQFREAHPGALTELPVSEFASPYPTLTALLGPQLAEMERVCALGQSGKYAGKRPEEYSGLYHLGKASGHMDGPLALTDDGETGAPHILLAAIRLMMADAARANSEASHG